MTHWFGRDAQSYVVDSAGNRLVGPTASFSVWDSRTGGAQLVTVIDETGNPIENGIVYPNADGWLIFGDPSESALGVWLQPVDRPDSPRVYLWSRDMPDVVSALDTDAGSSRDWVPVTAVGAQSGVAPLDGLGRVPRVHLPTRSSPTIDILMASTPFFIAHRGSGDEHPEHTLIAYDAAIAAGAQAVEISAQETADGALVCMHDPTLDRTTNASGAVNARTFGQLRSSVRSDMSRWLGPAWAPDNADIRLDSLKSALDRVIGSAVAFVEIKNASTRAARATMDLLESYNSMDTVVWKQWNFIGAAVEAKSRGFKIWSYMDADFTSEEITNVCENADYIGVPHTASDAYISSVVNAAGEKPVICWEVHRRADVTRLLALGVRGMMCSGITYVPKDEAIMRADSFITKCRAPGDMGLANLEDWMPLFTDTDAVTLDRVSGTPQAYLLGSLSPVAGPAESYSVTFDVRWETLPAGLTERVDIAFGHDDDSEYRASQSTNQPGYHFIIRANGGIRFYRHSAGTSSGTALGAAEVSTPTAIAGEWMRFKITVTGATLTAVRLDPADDTQIGTTVTAADTTHRGGYIHLSKATSSTAVSFRRILVEDVEVGS